MHSGQEPARPVARPRGQARAITKVAVPPLVSPVVFQVQGSLECSGDLVSHARRFFQFHRRKHHLAIHAHSRCLGVDRRYAGKPTPARGPADPVALPPPSGLSAHQRCYVVPELRWRRLKSSRRGSGALRRALPEETIHVENHVDRARGVVLDRDGGLSVRGEGHQKVVGPRPVLAEVDAAGQRRANVAPVEPKISRNGRVHHRDIRRD